MCDLDTYSQRVARIIEIVEPYVQVRQYVLDRADPNPFERTNGLSCRWFDRCTHVPMGSVNIDEVDPNDTLDDLRAQVTGEEYYQPGMATEVTGLADGEHVFLQHYGPSVTAIVGRCRVVLVPPRGYQDLANLVDPILTIAHTVGCSAYMHDVPGSTPSRTDTDTGWGIGPGFPSFPSDSSG